MKRKEILMLVCAFFLGFFANAIMKSSCMSKLYEGAENHDGEGCGHRAIHFIAHQDGHHEDDNQEEFLAGCDIQSTHTASLGLGS